MIKPLVALLAKTFKPELGDILPSSSNVLTLDTLYTRPTVTIIVVQILQGDLDIDTVKKACSQLAPETRSYITEWCGYTFWKPDPSFNIDNHISLIKTDEPLEDKLDELKSQLFQKPYQPNQSPWEMVILKNTKNGKVENSVLITRCHHAMVDGFSLMKQLEKPMTTDKYDKPIPWPPTQVRRVSLFTKLWEFVKLIVFGSFEFLMEQISYNEDHEWSFDSCDYAREYYFSKPVTIDIKYLKKLKNSLKVGLNSVVLAAYAGAIRKSMLEQKRKLPNYVKIFTPLVLPGHPDDKCTNHMGVGSIKLPIANPDSLDRLKDIDGQLQKIKSSYLPAIGFLFHSCIGSMPRWMIKLVITKCKSTVGSGIFSSMSGYQGEVYKYGLPQLDYYFLLGLLMENLSLGFGAAGFGSGNTYTINFIMDKGIFPTQEEVNDFTKNYVREIKILEKIPV